MFRTTSQMLTRQVVLFALSICGFFLLIAIFAIANLVSMQRSADHIAAITLQQVEFSGQFNTDMFRSFAEALAFARTRQPENRESAVQEMRDAQTLLNELGRLEPIANPDDPDVTADHVQLQSRRVEAYNVLQPAIAALVRAVDIQDDAAITAALDVLNSSKLVIEQLEEDTSNLADTSVNVATNTIKTRVRWALISTGIAICFVLLVIPVSVIFVRRHVVSPIAQLAIAAHAVATGKLDQQVAVTTATELGQLQRAFNQMVTQLAVAQAAVTAQQHLLEDRVRERTATLEHTLAELRSSVAVRDELSATLQTLSSPIMPISDDVLVMPLIGEIDSARAQLMTTTLLEAIEDQHARRVIIDVTGVPLIDTHVAQTLLQAAQASRLLGTETILVGIRPELAQTIVGLGINLAAIVTRADLQSGIRYALQPDVRREPAVHVADVVSA